MSNNIYQFKVTLLEVYKPNPRIWRRIQVPANFNFQQLHLAITDAMGWKDYHLHSFNCVDEADEIHTKIEDYFGAGNKTRCRYEYDFGDGWQHEVLFEKVVPASPEVEYPLCVKGVGACPPEDCGGTYGYAELLQTLNGPNNRERTEMVEWLQGCGYNPESFGHFDVTNVVFRK